MIGATAALSPGHRACVQILARPVTGRRLARAHRAAAILRGARASRPVGRFFDLITPTRERKPYTPSAYIEHPEYALQVRAILDKASHPQWEVLIRYGLTADASPAVRPELRGRAHALAAAFAVYAGHNRLRRRRGWWINAVMARRWLVHGDLLSVPELAALAHLPLDPAVPGLDRAGARSVPPPPSIPKPGPDAKPLGDSDAGVRRPIGLGVTDARQHTHVIGATGSGKSTLLAGKILADAEAGRGAALIDPKGDLINDLLERLPKKAAGKVVLIDPDQGRGHPALNVLRGPDRDLAVDNLVGIFHRIYRDAWGPRTDDILRSACLTVWNDPDATLADVPRLLAIPRYRAGLMPSIARNPMLTSFWSWYNDLRPAAQAHAVGPVLNKLRGFLLRDFIRTTIDAQSTFDPATVLDGGLLLVRLPKGVLGTDTAALLGSLIVAKIWETVTHRARSGEVARADSSLYLDGCHNFLTLPHGMDDLLAEARGYRLSVVLAHQNLGQLPRDLREAISTNARNKVYFAVSPEDARTLSEHVAPSLAEHDLVHLGAYQAAGRLIVGSAETPAFTLHTRPLPPPTPGRARNIRRASQRTYGRRPLLTYAAPPRLPVDDPRLPAKETQ